jgi:para-aminobenzoate synthetase component 1
MLIYDKNKAISVMNNLGAEGIPFVFLVDFEMKKIIISTDFHSADFLSFEMNGYTNHSNIFIDPKCSYLEPFPIDLKNYKEKFKHVKSEIQKGNTFLLNLSFPSKILTDLSLEEIYQSTEAKYKILLQDQFICFSPEIFVQINNGKISSFPMKGTIDASIENAEKILLEDTKELAEHYTIVDLIRNDLSRVAKQVKVDRFRYVDKIKTSQKDLLQISSEISGILPQDYTTKIGSILFELLPAGSISGAPKPKTLEIIQDVEGRPRGYYTGICGYFDGKNLDSGVMIRYIENIENTLYYRSGGGITSMSEMEIEYQEMIDKVYLPLSTTLQSDSSLHQTNRNGS